MSEVMEALSRIEERQIEQGKDVAALKTEVFGTGTTEGLATKVDGLNYMKKDAGKVSVIVSAITGTVLIIVGKLLGLDVA